MTMTDGEQDLVFSSNSNLLFQVDVSSSYRRAQRAWFVLRPYRSCSHKQLARLYSCIPKVDVQQLALDYMEKLQVKRVQRKILILFSFFWSGDFCYSQLVNRGIFYIFTTTFWFYQCSLKRPCVWNSWESIIIHPSKV